MQDKDIQQLVNEESFLNYCFKRNSEDVLYWEKWLQENPGNKQEVEQLRLMLLLMGDESKKRIKDASYAELQEKIKYTKRVLKPKVYPFWKKWSTVAAAVLLAISTALFIYTNLDLGMSGRENHDVGPGGHKATLILANGEKINLTDAANGSIVNQSGIQITKSEDGQIVYNVSASVKHVSDADYNTIETPIGGQYQVNLSDGTRVWLNAGSSLRYPLKFSGTERKVELTGEGYFEVAHNKALPFKVESLGQMVEVLGTHFNVSAYRDEKVVKTTLLEGSVRLSHENSRVVLSPGQQSQLVNEKINVVNGIDLEDVIAWKNGYFKFNENLTSIMSKVSRWYDVEVIYQMKPDPNLTFSGKISRAKNISAILKGIEFSGDVHFRIEGRKIYVMK